MSGDGLERPTLGFVGAGRAASALAAAWREAGRRVVAVSSRRTDDAAAVAERAGAVAMEGPASVVAASDLTFLTVPDPGIRVVAAAIRDSGADLRGRAIVHCSARMSREELNVLEEGGAATGVLHPLQALAGAGSAANLRGASFRVEGAGRLRAWLEGLVGDLEGSVVEIASDQLDLYHAAAVLAGNAPLALLDRAATMLERAGVDALTARRALARLLEGAAANAGRDPAGQPLTGPVARGDAQAVGRHLAALDDDPETHELYLLMARELSALMARRAGQEPARVLRRPASRRGRVA